MRFVSYTLLVTLFVVPGTASLCQDNKEVLFKRCPVKTINFEQGLLNNGTTNILTDELGFTWISTVTGMQRFNGYTLERVNPVIGRDTIWINSPVFFFGRQNGTIWISYKAGILSYNPRTDAFTKIITLPPAENAFYTLIPLKENGPETWCLQENKGIVVYNDNAAAKGGLRGAGVSFADSIMRNREPVHGTVVASNDRYIFILTSQNLLLQVNINTRQSGYIDCYKGIAHSIACNNDRLYIVSTEGLYAMDIGSGMPVNSVLFRDIVHEPVVGCSVRLTEAGQLLASVNRYLFEFDTACRLREEWTTLDRNPIMTTGFIGMIYTDRFRRIWLLTNDDIKRIQNREIPFDYFIYPGEKNNFTRSLYYDEQKHVLLAGGMNGGIRLYDTLAYPLWPEPLMTTEVKDIIGIEKLAADDYLVITFRNGWWLLHLSTQQLRPFELPPAFEALLHTRPATFSNNIQRVDDSTLLIATRVNAFRCIFRGTKILSVTALLPASGKMPAISCLLYASDGTTWVGSQGGLVYRLSKYGALQVIHISGQYSVRSVTEDALHRVWIGSEKGAYIYTRGGRFTGAVTRETGLLNDCIYAMLPSDDKGSVFASSNLGLSQVAANGDIKNYPKELGLQENEFNTGAAVKTSTGKLYFGGVNGITAFYPAALSIVRDSALLSITRLVVNDSLYNSSAGIWKGDTILLDYYQNHLQIDLAAMGLLNANEYEYKYRLKGFEKNWQVTHQPTGISYILEPGQYQLEIRCSPILSSNIMFSKTITLIIYPPWWQSWWFRIIGAIAVLAAVALVVMLYNRRRYLEKIRVLQLHSEIQNERERISRDLHDNLGAYASAISMHVDEIVLQAPAVSDDLLQRLKSNASEIIINLRDTIWTLNKASITVTSISDRFKAYVQKIKPSSQNMQIVTREQVDHDLLLSPSLALNIYRIMQESLQNAIRHSKATHVRVDIVSNHRLYISIADDGTGIAAAAAKGNGLFNMKLRAKETGLNLTIETTEGEGTRIIITNG